MRANRQLHHNLNEGLRVIVLIIRYSCESYVDLKHDV